MDPAQGTDKPPAFADMSVPSVPGEGEIRVTWDPGVAEMVKVQLEANLDTFVPPSADPANQAEAHARSVLTLNMAMVDSVDVDPSDLADAEEKRYSDCRWSKIEDAVLVKAVSSDDTANKVGAGPRQPQLPVPSRRNRRLTVDRFDPAESTE